MWNFGKNVSTILILLYWYSIDTELVFGISSCTLHGHRHLWKVICSIQKVIVFIILSHNLLDLNCLMLDSFCFSPTFSSLMPDPKFPTEAEFSSL